MKKSLLGIAALSLVFASVVNAQLLISDIFSWKEALNAGSYAKLLSEYDDSWWYTSRDVIEWEMTGGVLSITSPIVVDDLVSVVSEYRLILSPYRMEALKAISSGVELSNVVMKNVRLEWDSSEISVELSAEEDNLDPEIWYYGVIVPLNMYDVIWTPSNEFCFQLSGDIYAWDGEGCDAFELVINPAPVEEDTPVDTTTPEGDTESNVEATESGTGEHGAACAWMDLANVSHSVKGDTVTLTWTAVDGDSVQIAIFDPEDEVYKSLGTAKMSDEKFSYKMQWNWEQNFMLTNGCKEVYYKADAAVKAEPIEVTPATGPAENVLYIAIATIVLYGAYVVFFRKADNK